MGVFRASTHEQETLGVIGSHRKSQQYTPQPLTLGFRRFFSERAARDSSPPSLSLDTTWWGGKVVGWWGGEVVGW